MKKCNVLDWVTGALVVIGALNWGLIGIWGEKCNLVVLAFSSVPLLVKIVYIVIGVAGLYLIFKAFGCCKAKKCCNVKDEA